MTAPRPLSRLVQWAHIWGRADNRAKRKSRPPTSLGRPATAADRAPAIRCHEIGPAAVQVAQIVLARSGIGQVHHPAGEGKAVPLEIVDFVAHSLLVIIRVAAGDD